MLTLEPVSLFLCSFAALMLEGWVAGGSIRAGLRGVIALFRGDGAGSSILDAIWGGWSWVDSGGSVVGSVVWGGGGGSLFLVRSFGFVCLVVWVG